MHSEIHNQRQPIIRQRHNSFTDKQNLAPIITQNLPLYHSPNPQNAQQQPPSTPPLKKKRTKSTPNATITKSTPPSTVSKDGHIKRPRNAFIIFRNHYQPTLIKSINNSHLSSKDFSDNIGRIWKSLSKEEREPYEEMARQEREAHKRMYPDFQYTRPRNSAGGGGVGKKEDSTKKKKVTPSRSSSNATAFSAYPPTPTPSMTSLLNTPPLSSFTPSKSTRDRSNSISSLHSMASTISNQSTQKSKSKHNSKKSKKPYDRVNPSAQGYTYGDTAPPFLAEIVNGGSVGVTEGAGFVRQEVIEYSEDSDSSFGSSDAETGESSATKTAKRLLEAAQEWKPPALSNFDQETQDLQNPFLDKLHSTFPTGVSFPSETQQVIYHQPTIENTSYVIHSNTNAVFPHSGLNQQSADYLSYQPSPVPSFANSSAPPTSAVESYISGSNLPRGLSPLHSGANVVVGVEGGAWIARERSLSVGSSVSGLDGSLNSSNVEENVVLDEGDVDILRQLERELLLGANIGTFAEEPVHLETWTAGGNLGGMQSENRVVDMDCLERELKEALGFGATNKLEQELAIPTVTAHQPFELSPPVIELQNDPPIPLSHYTPPQPPTPPPSHPSPFKFNAKKKKAHSTPPAPLDTSNIPSNPINSPYSAFWNTKAPGLTPTPTTIITFQKSAARTPRPTPPKEKRHSWGMLPSGTPTPTLRNWKSFFTSPKSAKGGGEAMQLCGSTPKTPRPASWIATTPGGGLEIRKEVPGSPMVVSTPKAVRSPLFGGFKWSVFGEKSPRLFGGEGGKGKRGICAHE
ncbi:hypothetical protein HDV05_008111 [Chytridiales sp. JEL 0842]|nr:hypothetical protein HDV05_008111 [Chytridiales sp. JEL 0842]